MGDNKEKNYLELINTIAVGIIVSTDDGKIIEVNDAVKQLFGYDSKDSIDNINTLNHWVNPKERDKFVNLLKKGSVYNFEAHFKRKDRTLFWASATSICKNTKDGKRFFSCLLDISERKKAEEELAKSEERYSLAQKAADIGSWDFDIVTGKLHWSEGIEPLFGFKKGEFKGSYNAFLDCVHPEDKQDVIDAVNASILENKSYSIEHRIICPDGIVRWILEKGDVFLDEKGEAIRMLGIVQDITKQKKFQEQLSIFKKFVEGSSIGHGFSDLEGNIIYINPMLTKMLGEEKPEDAIGKNVDIYYPETIKRLLLNKIIPQVHKTGNWLGELPLQSIEGKITSAIQNISLIRDDQGNSLCLGNIITDISERKKMEQLVRIQRDLGIALSSVADFHKALKICVDAAVKASGMDCGCIYLFEDTAESIKLMCCKGMPCDVAARIEDNKKKNSNINNVFEGIPIYYNYAQIKDYFKGNELCKDLKSIAFIPIRYNEKVIACFTIASKTFDEIPVFSKSALETIASQLGGVISSKKSEESLNVERVKAQKYLDVAGTMFVVLDPEGNVTLINKKGCEILDYKEEEIIGKNWFDNFLPKSFRKEVKQVFEKIISDNTKIVEYFENPVLTKNGEERIIAWHNTNIIDNDGRIVSTLSSGSDITEKKKADKERENLIEDLEQKNAEMEQFTYIVSHDLKSPLITIRGFIGLLEKDIKKGDIKKAVGDIEHIYSAAERMQLLLEDLLKLSKLGRVESKFKEFSVEKLLAEVLKLLSSQIDNNKVDIKVIDNLPIIYGDYERLLAVFQNLIDNAIKFMGDQDDPYIEIGFEKNNGEYVFYVLDNGIGIDPRYQKKIFDIFDRLDPNVEGTGIGLAIVKRIINLHNGKIWIESEGEGKGSKFCFTLPERVGING